MEKKAKHTIVEGWPHARLARELGDITPQAISQWERVPAKRVLDIERITGVSRHQLRPDIFGEVAA